MSADNSPTQTKSWSSAGTYNVRCTVSDMKGKTFVKSILIRVGTPSTFTISGRVTKPDGTPVQNVLVNEGTIARVAKDPYALYSAYTDADGYYSIGPLPNANGGYKIYAVRDGWQISALSSMPVIVTNNVVNCNFKATQSTEQRGLTLEHWSNIAGNTIEDLIPHLSETPSFSRVLTRFFEVAPDFADNYGQRMKGYFIPPTTGAYTFYLSSNEQSQLYLSTNNLAENKRPIANVVSANYYPHYWRWGPSQKSAAIFLTAGERYYIEALHKEGANRDHFSVGADFPGDIEQFPIHAAYLRPMSSPVISPPIPATAVTLAATDPLAKEGTTDTGTFTVTRSGSLANALPVFFSNTGTATYAADYFPTGLSVVIPAGASSAKIVINPVDDTLSEPDETATLQLAPAVTYTLGLVTKGTVTILDNELPEINIVATQPIMTESGEETATFTFIRTGSPAMAISTNFAISGTADRGVDYLNLPNTVTIPAGQTSASVTITAIADTSEEPQETIIFSLLPGSGYVTKLPLTATGYILAQPLLIKWKLAENGNWTDSSKWLTDRPTAGGSIAYELNFNATGSSYSSINDLGNNYRLNKLNFGGAAASLSGGSLRWVANLSGYPILNQNDGNTVSISNELILTTAFTVGGSGNGAVNLTGYISGAGSLNKTHSGRLYLSTNNSYTGGTTVRRGSIDISEPQKTALGMGTIILESGTSLTLNRNIMENELILKAAQLNSYNGYGDQWLGNIILTDVSTIDLSNTGNFTISGNIYGTGGLKKIGISSRALTLSGISSYTGTTTIAGGVLACSRPESLAQGTLRINSGAKLELNFNTTRQVSALQLNSDTFQPNGIYGSVASGATHQYDAYFSGTGTITVGPLSATPFASWATAQGLSGANNITQMADPDRDGICNLLEFTLGSSPVAASVATVPKLKINNDGPMTFEYDRNDASLSSVTGVVEYGNDLIGWTVIPIPLTSSTQVTITDGPLKDHVVVSIPNNDDHVFVRLRVSQ
jgi:autotransporter-associated beta strand protein